MSRKWRLKPGWYFALWLVLSVAAGVAINPFLPSELVEAGGIIGMALGTLLTYPIYMRIERGRFSILPAVKVLLFLAVLACMVGVLVVPLAIIVGAAEMGLWRAVRYVLRMAAWLYGPTFAAVTIGTWFCDKSPGQFVLWLQSELLGTDSPDSSEAADHSTPLSGTDKHGD